MFKMCITPLMLGFIFNLKGQFRCKMDLGYVLYDNELERLFWSTKN